ncbi:MAG: hypothetical protein EU547_01015 [Promethearchaeota archaeon]|nr:MAG: hypothetical protein EU547_01015 [Candidatus Lokiarchaeota archaeon]
MKFKNNRLIKITCLVAIFLLFSVLNFSVAAYIERDYNFSQKEYIPRTSQSWVFNQLTISESGGGNGTWTWAVTQDWCRGSGTEIDPYIIENVTINASGIIGISGISIINSKVYFIIKNNNFHNSGSDSEDAGIKLLNTNNGIIQSNNFSFNQGNGIYLENSSNNRILENHIYDNQYHGIYINEYSEYILVSHNTIFDNSFDGIRVYRYSHNATLVSNMIYNNLNGIFVTSNCYDSFLKENSLINNTERGIGFSSQSHRSSIEDNYFEKNGISTSNPGLYAVGTNFLSISNNTFKNNYHGVSLRYVFDCEVYDNEFLDNYYNAIYLEFLSEDNNITNNFIINSIYGIYVYDRCENTIISQNAFIQNDYGIQIARYSHNNVIKLNYLLNNEIGFDVTFDSDATQFSYNTIKTSSQYGVDIGFDCDNTLLFQNYFIYNEIQVRNGQSSSQWNFTTLGNYWTNYSGYDADDNGIGDIPHPIISQANGIDYYPIFKNMPSIFIDEYTEHNWDWAAKQYWVNGTGTEEDPYIIQNKIIDKDWRAPAIEIRNSDKFFIISNCTLSTEGAIFPGIKLYNVKNGVIVNSTIYETKVGIDASNCSHLTITMNDINLHGTAISLSQSEYNMVSNNNLDHNAVGLFIYQSHENAFIENSILSTESCINEYQSHDNLFQDNLCDPIPLKLLYMTVIDQIFTTQIFNITFFIHNATYDGIDANSITILWNSTDMSTNVTSLGNGYYIISLNPIFVGPGESGIPIELTINTTGYEVLTYSSDIAVDPEAVTKEVETRPPTGAIPWSLSTILIVALFAVVGSVIYYSKKKF